MSPWLIVLGVILMVPVTTTLIEILRPDWSSDGKALGSIFWPIGLAVLVTECITYTIIAICGRFDPEKRIERQIAKLERERRLERKRAELRRLQEKAFDELMKM